MELAERNLNVTSRANVGIVIFSANVLLQVEDIDTLLDKLRTEEDFPH